LTSLQKGHKFPAKSSAIVAGLDSNGQYRFQGGKEKIKKLTMFVVSMLFLTSAPLARASEPVPGAEITVEQVSGPVVVKKCVTDSNGEFSVTVAEIEAAYKNNGRAKIIKQVKPGDVITFLMTIKRPVGFMSATNQVSIARTVTSENQRFVFTLVWEKEGHTKTNKGSFAINPKAQSLR
jgi:hypothetical protein